MAAARTTDPPVDHPDLAVEMLGVEHWPAVREIYAEGLLTGHASFETEPPQLGGLPRRAPAGSPAGGAR